MFRLKLNEDIISKISSASDKTEEISSLRKENERIKGVLKYYEDKRDN